MEEKKEQKVEQVVVEDHASVSEGHDPTNEKERVETCQDHSERMGAEGRAVEAQEPMADSVEPPAATGETEGTEGQSLLPQPADGALEGRAVEPQEPMADGVEPPAATGETEGTEGQSLLPQPADGALEGRAVEPQEPMADGVEPPAATGETEGTEGQSPQQSKECTKIKGVPSSYLSDAAKAWGGLPEDMSENIPVKRVEKVIPYDILKDMRAEDGIEMTKKEHYLDPEEFSRVFGLEWEAFQSLPLWRRQMLKKKVGLF